MYSFANRYLNKQANKQVNNSNNKKSARNLNSLSLSFSVSLFVSINGWMSWPLYKYEMNISFRMETFWNETKCIWFWSAEILGKINIKCITIGAHFKCVFSDGVRLRCETIVIYMEALYSRVETSFIKSLVLFYISAKLMSSIWIRSFSY